MLRINCAPSWFNLQDYTWIHGQQNIKSGYAKQAKQAHEYKNIKTKLCKMNAAFWYNKMCRPKQSTPNNMTTHVKHIKFYSIFRLHVSTSMTSSSSCLPFESRH